LSFLNCSFKRVTFLKKKKAYILTPFKMVMGYL
jgi:hypothetical protein